jgi:hypothetical protein
MALLTLDRPPSTLDRQPGQMPASDLIRLWRGELSAAHPERLKTILSSSLLILRILSILSKASCLFFSLRQRYD